MSNLQLEQTLEYEFCTDHHLTLPMGEDNFLDIVVTDHHDTSTFSVEFFTNIKGDRQELLLKENVSRQEAERIIDSAK
jgi:hypothetical protein